MKISRLAAALAFTIPLGLGVGMPAPAQAETTITAVMQAPLRSLDPIVTTALIIQNFGFMVYDTLLSTDANGDIKPQMLEKWEVSRDGKTYTFTLRDELKWHDGSPVTSADCIASIKRWGSQDKMGQTMMSLTDSFKEIDDKTFSMTFTTATNIGIRALGKPSSQAAFMMPKRLAETPTSQPITEAIGSGPFKFVQEEFKPGVQAVFVKNEDYVPRDEPPSGMAGGHVVKVDKVRWVSMPDDITAINAIKKGEIDFIEQTPYDLLPLLDGDEVRQIVATRQGGQPVMRLNHSQPPFDNIYARQAALAAIDQEQILQADIGNEKYFRTCAAMFGCDTKYATDAGSEDLIRANPEKSKELLKKAGYDGTPIVLLRPTDFPNAGGSFAPVIAQELRQGGFEVEIQAMDWQTVIQRRTSKKPIADGGWNIFTTYLTLADIADPLSNYSAAANGDKAWFGWPDSPEIESLRHDFATTVDEEKLKELAVEIQKKELEEVVVVPLGEFVVVTAVRKSVSGIVPDTSAPVFWSMEKAAD